MIWYPQKTATPTIVPKTRSVSLPIPLVRVNLLQQLEKNLMTRTGKVYFGLAMLSLILGVGNILFSELKMREYSRILDEVNREDSGPRGPAAVLEVNRTAQDSYDLKVRSRIEFYQIALSGGRVFLAVSGMLLLVVLISARGSKNKQ